MFLSPCNCLKDLSTYIKQNISPNKINTAFKWLKENNPLYKDVEYDEGWVDALQDEELSNYGV